jgi:hypothetical protein
MTSLLTEIQKSNDLRHKIETTDVDGNPMYINIRLNDEYKNGHQDFGITANIYQKGKPKIDRYYIAGGCCHDEILKARPDLKIFVDLHLCDYSGAPMYAIGNGFYFLKGENSGKSPKVAKDYLRLTESEFQKVLTCENEIQLGVDLVEMGVIKRWKQEADEAIKILESWTGKEFVNDSKRSQYTPPTEEQIKDEQHKQATGYYTPEQVQQRAETKAAEKKQKALNECIARRDKEIKEATDECNVKTAVIMSGLPINNFIYYNHSNEGVFNWNTSSYNRAITQEEFELFLSKVDYTNLPKGIKFKLSK